VTGGSDHEVSDPRWSLPLADLLVQRCRATPDLTMARDEHGRSLTFGELGAHSKRVAQRLAAVGVGPSSRVAWQLPTWLETLVLTCALARLRVIQIPIPYLCRANEVRAAIEQTDADLLVTPGHWQNFDFGAMAADIVAARPGLRSARVDRGQLDTANWFDGIGPPPDTGPRRDFGSGVQWVFFTSGTSGSPKGVLHTDRSVTIPSTTMADAFELTSVDRSAVAFPLGHIGGVAWLIATLQTGCCLLLAERFDDRTIDSFQHHGVTLAGVSTAFHLAYRDRARRYPDQPLFPRVRAYPGGAATKPPTLHTELRTEIGGVGIVAGYGLTECPMISMARVSDPDEMLAHTEGRLSPGMQATMHDPVTGVILADGEPGEVRVRGPQLFQGYIHHQDTVDAFDEAGYFRTGDIGYLDADGHMVISGRLKDVIIRKGENISAKEIEDHIFTHPGVADVAVIGLIDDEVGERCCAVLVAPPDHSVPSVNQLGDYLRARGLMTQKWPERIYELPALPRNSAGKVLKHELIREITAGTLAAVKKG
jgi:cyclohexanecarboxylate-CoA ligase